MAESPLPAGVVVTTMKATHPCLCAVLHHACVDCMTSMGACAGMSARLLAQLSGLRLGGGSARGQLVLALLRLQHLAQAECQAALVQRLRSQHLHFVGAEALMTDASHFEREQWRSWHVNAIFP